MKFHYMLLGYPLHIFYRICNLLMPNPILFSNRKFKNYHKGQACFILGSGPSIGKQDLTKLSGQIVMTQNHFHAHKDIKTINPTYHVMVQKYQSKDYDNDWRDWLSSMEERLPRDCQLFAGDNTKYLIDEFDRLKGRMHYIHTGLKSIYMRKAFVDITKNIMKVPTALTECLTITLYMGFEKIYLLGFDLNQLVILQEKENGREQLRFYGLSPITSNAAEIKIENKTATSGDNWFWMWEIWAQLNLLKNYAMKHNIQIINLTKGGLLNVFPREDYEDVIRKIQLSRPQH